MFRKYAAASYRSTGFGRARSASSRTGTGRHAGSVPRVSASPGRTGRPPVTSRPEILAAARRLIDRDGWEKLTVRRLAAELGIGTTTLYHHVQEQGFLLLLLLNKFWQEARSSSRRCVRTIRGSGPPRCTKPLPPGRGPRKSSANSIFLLVSSANRHVCVCVCVCGRCVKTIVSPAGSINTKGSTPQKAVKVFQNK